MSEMKKFPGNFYWGETVRVRNAGSILQGLVRFFASRAKQKIQQVDSFCKKTVARPCQIFLEFMNRNIVKVYRTCKQSLLTLHSQQKGKYTFLSLLVCVSKVPAT